MYKSTFPSQAGSANPGLTQTSEVLTLKMVFGVLYAIPILMSLLKQNGQVA
jgi:Sec-independent protein secretion pathway component TatC